MYHKERGTFDIIKFNTLRSSDPHIDGLTQKRRNSIANALELRLSCTNPLIYASVSWVIIGLESGCCLFCIKPLSEPITGIVI